MSINGPSVGSKAPFVSCEIRIAAEITLARSEETGMTSEEWLRLKRDISESGFQVENSDSKRSNSSLNFC